MKHLQIIGKKAWITFSMISNSLALLSCSEVIDDRKFIALTQKIINITDEIRQFWTPDFDFTNVFTNNYSFNKLLQKINIFLDLIKTISYNFLTTWSNHVPYRKNYLNIFYQTMINEHQIIPKNIQKMRNQFINNHYYLNLNQLKIKLRDKWNKIQAYALTMKNYLSNAYQTKNYFNLESWQIIQLDFNIYQYYYPLLNKSGDELIIKINQLINKTMQFQSQHKLKNYNNLWNLYKTTGFKDLERQKEHFILDIYSKNPIGKDRFNYTEQNQDNKGNNKKMGTAYNREHLIPQSYFHKKSPMVYDAHHIFPTDGWTNSKRGNFVHDRVVNPFKITFANQTKMGKNQRGETVLEPDSAFKGDIARSYLYFALTYYNLAHTFSSQNIFKTWMPFIKQPYLTSMLYWHELLDPVDQYDLNRNNEIYKFQNNRNPFIDLPYLSHYIWNPSFKNRPLIFSLKSKI